jgi:hypothetical protein
MGAAVGGLTGALVGMGIPEYEAKRYEERLKKGNILISVRIDEHARHLGPSGDQKPEDRVKDIFKRAGLEEIHAAGLEDIPSEQRESRRF